MRLSGLTIRRGTILRTLVSALLLLWAVMVLVALLEWVRRDWIGLLDLQKDLPFFAAGEATTVWLRSLPLSVLRSLLYMLILVVAALAASSAYLVVRFNSKAVAMTCAIAAAGCTAWIYYGLVIDLKWFIHELGFNARIYWSLLIDFATFAGISTGILMAQLILRYPIRVTPSMLRPGHERLALRISSRGSSDSVQSMRWHARVAGWMLSTLQGLGGMLLSEWFIAFFCLFWLLGVGLGYSTSPLDADNATLRVFAQAMGFLEFGTYVALLSLSMYWIFFASRHVPKFDQSNLRWSRACLAIASVVFLTFEFGSILIGRLAGEAYGEMIADIGGMVQLPIYSFLLLLSMLYRGEGDPTLKVRKICLWSAIAVAVTGLFLLIEVLAVSSLVKWLTLPTIYAQLATVVLTAGLVGPLRKRVDSHFQAWIATMLPAEDLANAERREAIVSFTDISGYTKLSVENEETALMVASVLKRLSIKIAADYGSRMVKSIGDAVMLEHRSSLDAARFLLELHATFKSVAANLTNAVPPLHSGVHVGVVAVSIDKDLFGNTVNIAARIQDAAKSEQILLSSQVLAALDGCLQTVSVGLKSFKNVSEPVECFLLVISAISHKPASLA